MFVNGWLAVGQGKLEDKHLVFENIEPFVIYQPLTYKDNELIPITYPFMYKKDKVHIFVPDRETQKVALIRKYPLRKTSSARYKNWLLLTEIRGANNPRFSNSDLLHKMEKLPPKNVIEVNINSPKKYQFFQYQVPKDSVLSIAEIHFFDENHHKITFDSIYSNGKPWKNIDLYQLKNCCDNDPVSFFHTWENGTSIFFKSKTPKKVSKIQFIPRNDDNFIREGDIYELFYNDGKNGWVSLGEQRATNKPVLHYIAPKNAVLWLKNKTRGKEEQLFTYENDRQIFPTFEAYGK
ncbi:hypothetical protein [Capnocytophaga sp.]|uniref:hypothetical protein n=1 Tax=Capnocytophaga sp. TaxID=44737 RepID=UPI0026DCCDC7|nr:hypothetical protein [Capnocytophaga sp.]MDO5106272.1 hypothetical protein [Capnocytophaga sp.]